MIVEASFRPLQSKADKPSVESDLLAAFFSAVNTMVDDLQEAMRKGRDVSNMNRVLASENYMIILHYDPSARVLVCAIANPDDDTDVIIKVLQQIGNRFWKKYRKDLDAFRTRPDNRPFAPFVIDIQNLMRGGKAGEMNIELQVAPSALERIKTLGVITEEEFYTAKACKTIHTPLGVARSLGQPVAEVNNVLQKLQELDVIKIKRG